MRIKLEIVEIDMILGENSDLVGFKGFYLYIELYQTKYWYWISNFRYSNIYISMLNTYIPQVSMGVWVVLIHEKQSEASN